MELNNFAQQWLLDISAHTRHTPAKNEIQIIKLLALSTSRLYSLGLHILLDPYDCIRTTQSHSRPSAAQAGSPRGTVRCGYAHSDKLPPSPACNGDNGCSCRIAWVG